MKPAQAQLFLGVVLLDAVREDIRENKKMNVHYYEALKRALYKPAAFFKGIIFPLLDVSPTSQSIDLIPDVLVARVHSEGGCDHRLDIGPRQGSCTPCFSCPAPNSRDGLFR